PYAVRPRIRYDHAGLPSRSEPPHPRRVRERTGLLRAARAGSEGARRSQRTPRADPSRLAQHEQVQGMSEAPSELLDRQVRLAAFEFLTEQTHLHGETLSWARLLQGFDFRGRRVPLVSQPGIFKPAILPEVPLTIRTAAEEEGRVRP